MCLAEFELRSLVERHSFLLPCAVPPFAVIDANFSCDLAQLLLFRFRECLSWIGSGQSASNFGPVLKDIATIVTGERHCF